MNYILNINSNGMRKIFTDERSFDVYLNDADVESGRVKDYSILALTFRQVADLFNDIVEFNLSNNSN